MEPFDLPAPTTALSGWRASKWLAICEVCVVGLIFVAGWSHLIYFSKTPYLLVVAWISLRLRNLRWREVGLSIYRNLPTTLGLGVGLGLLTETFQLLVTQPALAALIGKQPELSALNSLKGNVALLLVGIALSWGLAAFGEELVFRGYLLNRVADLGDRTRLAWVAGVLVVSAVFGLSHSGQGATGMIEEGIAGLWLALMYFGTGRNLLVPIVAHGVQDTIDVILIYLDKFPGL